ncbi:MAG: lactonase family protein [Lentisphaerae bacterium]|nr:lactonase family protein [Lentisphaerota bacterium]
MALADSNGVPVYIGTYTGTGSKGIYLLRFDPVTGRMTDAALAAEAANPTFFDFNARGDILYSGSETASTDGVKSGAIAAFAVDPAHGALRLLNQQLSQGRSPCHVSLAKDGSAVFAANYSTGSVSMLPVLPDGRLAPVSCTIQHEGRGPDPERQEGPHAHSITPDPASGLLYACDLGLDRVFIYRAAEGALRSVPPVALQTHPGAGPRHLAFHPNGRWLYVVNELDSTVSVFTRPSPNEPFAPTEVQSLSALPPGTTLTTWCADIHIHPNQRFVYASNRGHDSLAVFAIDPDSGLLTWLEATPVEVAFPRSFTLDPSGRWILAAGQNSDTISAFAVNPETGRLRFTGQTIAVPRPVCLRFGRQGRPKTT